MAQKRGRPGARTPGGQETTQKASPNQEASVRSMSELSQFGKLLTTDEPQNGILPFAVYTIAKAASLLHVSERKVRDLAAAGELPRLRHTRNFAVWGEDLITFLRSMSAAKGDTP